MCKIKKNYLVKTFNTSHLSSWWPPWNGVVKFPYRIPNRFVLNFSFTSPSPRFSVIVGWQPMVFRWDRGINAHLLRSRTGCRWTCTTIRCECQRKETPMIGGLRVGLGNGVILDGTKTTTNRRRNFCGRNGPTTRETNDGRTRPWCFILRPTVSVISIGIKEETYCDNKGRWTRLGCSNRSELLLVVARLVYNCKISVSARLILCYVITCIVFRLYRVTLSFTFILAYDHYFCIFNKYAFSRGYDGAIPLPARRNSIS